MWGGDIACECDYSGDGLDWNQIDTLMYSTETISERAQERERIQSAPTMTLFTGMYLLATCNQPPGAAHKSIVHLADSRKLYFLLSWMSLKADRAR